MSRAPGPELRALCGVQSGGMQLEGWAAINIISWNSCRTSLSARQRCLKVARRTDLLPMPGGGGAFLCGAPHRDRRMSPLSLASQPGCWHNTGQGKQRDIHNPLVCALFVQVTAATDTTPHSPWTEQAPRQPCWRCGQPGHVHQQPAVQDGADASCCWPSNNLPRSERDVQCTSKVPKGYTTGLGCTQNRQMADHPEQWCCTQFLLRVWGRHCFRSGQHPERDTDWPWAHCSCLIH